jgi:ribonuclease P protein component
LARTNDLGHPRLGLAMSRKSLPLAVHRNRIKRMAREVLRHRQHDLGGVDFIILTRLGLKLKDWRRQDRERLRQTLDTHLTALASQCE